MVQSAIKLITVDEFITQYGDNNRYELIDGELIDIEPTGSHEQVAAFIGRKLNVEIDRQDIEYFIPFRCQTIRDGDSFSSRSNCTKSNSISERTAMETRACNYTGNFDQACC
jgi:Uma2 family endonuclease